MEIKEAIWDRRSIRRYKDKNINDDILKKIIEAGSMAPSACNQQRYSFIVINDVKVNIQINIKLKEIYTNKVKLTIISLI